MNQSVTLTWRNLTATIKDKIIVNKSTGFAKSGSTLAIMGPSGSGKTTLLTMLACRKPKGMHVDGTVRANSVTFTSKQFNGFGSFVYQNDILFESLTVRECLQFAADMKLRGTQEERNEAVTRIITELQLIKCQNTQIGGKFVQGVSGGQRKRTCVGIEMIANPAVLILDEPTSGLDSFTATIIINMLTRIAKQGKTVIFTIHQPSSRLFNMLDSLILLCRGQNIYQGPASQVVTYMSNLGIEIPGKYNVSDFFMFEVSDYKYKKEQKDSQFNKQAYDKLIVPSLEKEIFQLEQAQQAKYPQIEPVHGLCYQIGKIFKRSWTQTVRHPMMLRNRFFNVIITTLIIGGIFFNTAADNKPDPNIPEPALKVQRYLLNVQGLCFINITSMIMNGIFSIALLLPVERQVYVKEESSKTYSCLAYFIGKTMLQIPLAILFPLIYASIGYWMTGLDKTFEQFIVFAMTLMGMTLTGNGLGLMLGCLFEDAKKTSAMAPAVIMPLMVFSGLYSKLSTIPSWIAWVQYLSPFKYGLQSLMYNQFEGVTYLVQQGPNIARVNVLTFMDIDVTSFQALSILLGVSLLFYTLAYVFLRTVVSKLA